MSLRIRLDQLANGPVHEQLQLPTEWCAERLGAEHRPQPAQFSVDVRARLTGDVVQADCVVTGGYTLLCSKCADQLTLPFEVSFTHRFVPAGSLEAGDDPDDLFVEDPDLSEHDGQAVDLQSVSIEHAILALPFAPTCQDLPAGPCERWTDQPTTFGDDFPEEEEASPWDALKGLVVATDNDQRNQEKP